MRSSTAVAAGGTVSARSSRDAWLLTCASFACVTALYLPGVQRSVAGGDSGELITAACELGVAHPPGYPLFTLLARLALDLLPFGLPAYRVNLLNGLLGAIASASLCFTVCRLSGSAVAGVFAAGSFAVSRLAWHWSMAAEVFSLNNVFIGLLLCLSACFHTAGSAQQRDKFGCWGALCCGLSLCNQHTVVLYVLCIAPWVLGGLRTHKELSLPIVGRLGTCFLVGFLPYLYLPLSSFLNRARWSWGDQSSLGGLLKHLLRIEYGTFSLAKSETGTGMAQMLRAQLTHCLSDLSAPVLVLSGAALLLNPLNRSRGSSVLVWLLAAMVTLYSLFFAWRANLDISKPLFLRVVERFWVQGDAVLCVLAGLGLSSLCCELDRRLGRGGVWRAVGWIFTAGFIASQAHRHSRLLDQSENFVVDRFARNILNSIPNGSIVLTRGDLPGNSLRYLHYCEWLRGDLSLVEQEMMTYDWYVSKLGRHLPGVRFPGRLWDLVLSDQTFNLQRFLSENAGREVFACIGLPEGDRSWERGFSLWPWGVCEKLVPSGTPFYPAEWVRLTRNMYNWTEPYNSFQPGSWEEVANEEMWQSRMKTAFFLFDLAEKQSGSAEVQVQLYQLSYTVYQELVGREGEVEGERHPANWHKNLALASERLLRAGGGGVDSERLLSSSQLHFSLYLQREPGDPQAEAIRQAVHQLARERERLQQQ
ncbi:transmembrane protein 260-like [Acipenser ruthenus]|uniref:transmembrane protein 260-like n=1 Tax=Acipenser ruthenus TaxID=7906 RepID=UPI0027408938|nr:transmembrane protein 260-like [Acipenser ruthenus]